jgi:hypothetical protein
MLRAKRIGFLLEELCTRHGFCLPPLDQQRVVENPPDDPDAFAAEVYRAEGLDPSSDRDLYRAVRATIAKAFPDVPQT